MIEKTFVGSGSVSSLKLGMARGASMIALAEAGIIIKEISPKFVKKTVTGYGSASKEQIKSMIEKSQEKLSEMRSIMNQINSLIKLTKNKETHEMIKKFGNEIIDKISSIENNLYQNKIETSQDEINYERKWTNHITHLYNRITTDNQAPNDGMVNRVKELKDNYDKIIKPYNQIINIDLKKFTQYLKENNIERIIID